MIFTSWSLSVDKGNKFGIAYSSSDFDRVPFSSFVYVSTNCASNLFLLTHTALSAWSLVWRKWAINNFAVLWHLWLASIDSKISRAPKYIFRRLKLVFFVFLFVFSIKAFLTLLKKQSSSFHQRKCWY